MKSYIIVLAFIFHDKWQQTQYFVWPWRENAYHRTILNMDLWYFKKDFLDKHEKGISSYFMQAPPYILIVCIDIKEDATFRSELSLVWFISKDFR